MSKLEETILSTTPLKPTYYKRFIDDIFILWPHSISDLNDFISAFNNYHPFIKFTSEYDYNKITFLDVNIFKGHNFDTSNKLDVETHIKPTNRQAYVHADLFHPPGTSKGVTIGEMKRHLRTNSRTESFHAFKRKHRQNLLKRGYSDHFIYQHTHNIRFKNRSLALKPKLRTNKRRLAFITRFTPSAAKAMKIIRRFWPSLRNSKTFKHINLPPPTLTFTSNRNIKSHLVRAKLAPTEDDTSIPPINFSLIFDNPTRGGSSS